MKRNILSDCLRIARCKHGPLHPSWRYKSTHYSFIVQDNKILEMGVNRPESSPPIYFGYPWFSYIHSEVDVFRKARGIMDENKKWECVNIRLLKYGKPFVIADAAPCKECTEFLIKCGCRHIYFTTSGESFAKIII